MTFTDNDGIETGFVDYYLDNEDLMPPEFVNAYNKWKDENLPSNQLEENMKELIVNDLIDKDPDWEDDLNKFIDAQLQSYY